MSKDQFDDDCPDCRPRLFLAGSAGSAHSQIELPEDHPESIAMNRAWKTLTLAQKQCWHRATCGSSKDPNDLAAVQTLIDRFHAEQDRMIRMREALEALRRDVEDERQKGVPFARPFPRSRLN